MGHTYLTRLLDEIQETMRDDLLLVLAENDQGDTLVPQISSGAMHFTGAIGAVSRIIPACILNYAIIRSSISDEHGLSRVEVGAQGEHKLARGYMPSTTHSLHWVNDPGFDRAVREYLVAERDANQQDIEI